MVNAHPEVGRGDASRQLLLLRQYAIPALVLCAGVLLSLAMFAAVRSWEQRRLEQQFEAGVNDRVSTLKKELEADELVVQAMVSFYDGSQEVTRDEFTAFAAAFLAWQPDIRALEWVPRVRAAEVAAYEARARKEGLPGFRITEVTEGGAVAAAGACEEYFPVLFAEPHAKNVSTFGWDLASDPVRRQSLWLARDTGKMVATGQVALVQGKADESGFLIVAPIYAKGAPRATVEDRRASLEGFVLAAFEFEVFAEEVFEQLTPAGVDVHFFDVSAPAGRQHVYSHWTRMRDGPPPPAPETPEAVRADLRRDMMLALPQRNLMVVLAAVPALAAGARTEEPWIVLAAGLVVTTLLTGYLVSVKRHAGRTEMLAAQLTATNKSLLEQAAICKKAEHALRKSESKYRTLFEGTTDAVMMLDDKSFFDCNKATLKVFGCAGREEFEGRHPSEFSPPTQPDGRTSMDAARDRIGKAMTEGSHCFEWLHCRKDGSEFPAEVLLTRMELDGRLVLHAVVRDITDRKRMEEALSFKTTLLEAQSETSPDGILAVDEEGRSILFNKRFAELWKIPQHILDTRDDLRMREYGLGQLADPVEYKRKVAYLYEHRDEKSRDEIEFADGRFLDRYSSPLVGADGKYYGRIWYFRDITGRKRMEHELRRLAVIAEQAPEGIAMADLGGSLQFVNEAWARMHGYESGAELVGKHLSVFHTDEQMKTEVAPFNETVHRQGRNTGEMGHVRRDGTTFPAQMAVVILKDDKNEPCGLAGFAEDITGRKQAEQQLHESNSHLTQLNQELESTAARVKGLMDDVVRENVFTGRFANPSLTPCWEVKKCDDSACPSYRNRENLRCWEVAGTSCGGEVQGRFAKKLGSCSLCEVYRSARANPVFDLGETFNSMIAILRDRHGELEKANLQLGQAIEKANLMAAQAEQASAAKGEFLANMSHEIRTPMTAIMGFTDIIGASIECCPACPEHQACPTRVQNKENIQIVRRNGEHLLELINDILDISKIEAGKFVMDVQPCSLPAVIADVISMMRVRAEQRGILLSVAYETEIPETVHTDGARVRQALVNLVGNAVKFTERGGVRVAASFLPAWRDGLPAVRVKVIDTGIGIDEEKLAQLFQPFVQADASTSRKYGGTGLGLPISRHLAELLGGELVAEGTIGKGSTFTLTIPTGSLEGVHMLKDPAEAVHGEAAGPHPPAAGEKVLAGIRILVAEDGPDNQRLIRTILSMAGAQVELAADGREAVSKARAASFDVVLMDMQMPEMDGYEAARTLRAQGYAVPILALTAHAMTGDRDKCMAAGCTDHLTKPIDRGRLIDAVARHAGKEALGRGRAAPTPEPTAGHPEVMRSQYAGDPDLTGVLTQFVAGLPAQVEAMSLAARAGRREELQRLAHRLKGAGGSYGYPSLTEAARGLEDAARAGDVEAAGMALGRLTALSRAVVRGMAHDSVSKEVTL
jgi:PAS domain S-box-containing protein